MLSELSYTAYDYAHHRFLKYLIIYNLENDKCSPTAHAAHTVWVIVTGHSVVLTTVYLFMQCHSDSVTQASPPVNTGL